MSSSLMTQIKARMEQKTTEELTTIWTENDRAVWSDDAFKVISQILAARGVPTPNQKEWPRKPLDIPVDIPEKVEKHSPLGTALLLSFLLPIIYWFKAWDDVHLHRTGTPYTGWFVKWFAGLLFGGIPTWIRYLFLFPREVRRMQDENDFPNESKLSLPLMGVLAFIPVVGWVPLFYMTISTINRHWDLHEGRSIPASAFPSTGPRPRTTWAMHLRRLVSARAARGRV